MKTHISVTVVWGIQSSKFCTEIGWWNNYTGLHCKSVQERHTYVRNVILPLLQGSHFSVFEATVKVIFNASQSLTHQSSFVESLHYIVDHLEGWDVLYNILFCYIAKFLLHNRNFFVYIAFNLMLYSICYIKHMLHNIYCFVIYMYI